MLSAFEHAIHLLFPLVPGPDLYHRAPFVAAATCGTFRDDIGFRSGKRGQVVGSTPLLEGVIRRLIADIEQFFEFQQGDHPVVLGDQSG